MTSSSLRLNLTSHKTDSVEFTTREKLVYLHMALHHHAKFQKKLVSHFNKSCQQKDQRTEGWKDRRMDRPYFTGIFQLLQGFKKNLQNRSRIKGTCNFWPNWGQHGQTRILLVKKTMFLMYLWSSLVKKPATVDIKKTKHLQIITDPTNTSPSEAIHLAPCRDKIH